MRKRNVHIQFWLDKKEAETLRKRAKHAGLSSAAYVRHLINGVVPQDAPPPDYYAMMQQLYRIGSNLNQIAQKAHTLNVIDVQRYDAAVTQFEAAVKEITESMSNFDDIFSGQGDKPRWNDHPFDKEAWAAKKQEERKELYALADSTAAEISGDGEKYQKYLDVQARFSRYTPTNALLILAQMPEATQLKDFDSWKEAGVSVQRKPRSVKILEPGKEYDREDGTRGTSFEVKRVYDVSQTRGRVRSAPAVKLDDRVMLKALIHRSPVPIQTVDSLPNNMGALYDHDQQVIFVCRGMDSGDIFRSVSKELSHAELAGSQEVYNRSDAAFAAYSASYLLCKRYGVDVSDYNFSRLPASFRESNPQQVRETLTEIRDTANQISTRMYRALEQNRAPKSKEQER